MTKTPKDEFTGYPCLSVLRNPIDGHEFWIVENGERNPFMLTKGGYKNNMSTFHTIHRKNAHKKWLDMVQNKGYVCIIRRRRT